MAELVDFQKARLIASMPKNFQDAYTLNGKDDYYFHRFAPFCQAYAEYLLNRSSYTKYGEFISEYNRVVVQDELYKDYKETQDSLTSFLGIFNRNYNKAKLEDKRIPIENNEFRFERDLEDELYKAFQDYFGNELKVKRQEYLGYGKSDLTLNDVVAIELKRGKALRRDVYQTFEYSFEKKIKTCCLIAAEFDESVLEISKKLKVDCYSYSFMYEDVTGYPIGFWVEKVTSSRKTHFDKLLNEMDNAVHFTNYDPLFDIDETFNNKFSEVKEIMERTRMFINEQKKRLLTHYEGQGYDVSKGLEYVLEQLESEERNLEA